MLTNNIIKLKNGKVIKTGQEYKTGNDKTVKITHIKSGTLSLCCKGEFVTGLMVQEFIKGVECGFYTGQDLTKLIELDV